MPTTTEVEARLRRAAAACEPLVEDLLGDPPTPVTTPHRRPPARGWLAAAAAIVLVVALAGVALVAARDEPADDVQADGGGPAGPTTEAPAPPPVAEGLGVLLADGTWIDLGLPDEGEWTVGSGQLLLDVEGVAVPVLADLHQGTTDAVRTNMGGEPEEERLADDVVLLRGGDLTLLVVERDGWTLIVTVAAGGRPEANLDDDTVAALAAGLVFTVTPDGPVDVTGPGFTVQTATRFLEGRGPSGYGSTLQITNRNAGRVEPCEAPVPSSGRCIDGIDVRAFGPRGEEVLAEITLSVLGTEAPAGTRPTPRTSPVPTSTGLDVVLPDGATARLTLPPVPTWIVHQAQAMVTLGPDATEEHLITFLRQDRQTWATRKGATLADAPGEGASYADAGSDRWLVVERDGWIAVLPLAGEEVFGGALAGAQATELARGLTFRVEGAPTDLTGPGLAVAGVDVELRPDGASEDATDAIYLGTGTLAMGCTDSTIRCLDDGLVIMGYGFGGKAAVEEAEGTLDD